MGLQGSSARGLCQVQDSKLRGALLQGQNARRCSSGPLETYFSVVGVCAHTRHLRVLTAFTKMHHALVTTAAETARRCFYLGGAVSAACRLAGVECPLQIAASQWRLVAEFSRALGPRAAGPCLQLLSLFFSKLRTRMHTSLTIIFVEGRLGLAKTQSIRFTKVSCRHVSSCAFRSSNKGAPMSRCGKSRLGSSSASKERRTGCFPVWMVAVRGFPPPSPKAVMNTRSGSCLSAKHSTSRTYMTNFKASVRRQWRRTPAWRV